MDETNHQQVPDTPRKHRFAFWSQLGGGALAFAILLHVVALTIAGILIYHVVSPPKPPPPFGSGPIGDPGKQTAAQTRIADKKLAQITPASDIKRVVVENSQASLVVPAPSDDFGEKTPLSAMPGGGMPGPQGSSGVRNGPGSSIFPAAVGVTNPFRLIEGSLGKRCSKTDRLQRLKDNGGTPACEEAVIKGLRWLKANQSPDGSWGTHKAAMTGFALLAYFGHCETPISEEFGDSCLKGITYLVDLGMKNDGKLGVSLGGQPFCYEHAIATYALAEAATFCKEIKQEVPNLMEVTAKAGQFIIDNQHENGGWSYNYAKTAGHTDVSVVGWQIQALKSCSHTGLKFRGMPTSVNKGLSYLAGCQNENGGFGYVGSGDGQRDGYFTLTGVGVLCHQMWGKGKMEVRKGLKYIMQNSKFEYNTSFADLYGHYYESQAMMQAGGAEWKHYNNMFRDQLLNNQDADGSWKAPGGGKPIRAAGAEYVNDKVYRTCLCSLMLEVYYRFLTTGGGLKDRSGV